MKRLLIIIMLLSEFAICKSQMIGISQSSFTPNYLFHIYNSAGTGILFQATNSSTGNTTTDGLVFDFDASSNLHFKNQENTATAFWTNSSQRMTINNVGAVGINTIPAAGVNSLFLEVNSGATANAIYGHSSQVGGYLGMETNFSFGAGTVLSPSQTSLGAGVYATNPTANYTSFFAQSTGAATIAASVSYSNVWMANYNYVDNASTGYNPAASYSQLNVSGIPTGTWRQSGIIGLSQYCAASGNMGWSVGGEFGGLGYSQDAIGVIGIAQNTNSASGINMGVEGIASGGLINFGVYSDMAIGTSEYSTGPLAAGNYIVGIGNASFLRVSCSAAIGIYGFSATGGTTVSGYDGRILVVYVPNGYAVTFANESGAVVTAAQRILTGTGGNVTTTAAGGCRATFIYSYTDSRWILISLIN